MNAAHELSVERIEPWLAERLLPLDAPQNAMEWATQSDWDLNPGMTQVTVSLAAAAVLVALVVRPSGLQLILTRRADGLARHPGQIAFAGGRVEPGETVVQAAVREAEEEIGLDPVWVRPMGRGDSYRTITNFHVFPVIALVDARASIRPHEAEVAEVFETPFAWAMDPANVVRGEHEVAGVVRRYEVLEFEGRRIWGATAGVLRGLRMRLYGK